MQLSEQQTEALTELINIAFSRTAASLSELTGHRVLMDAPRVTVCEIGELSSEVGGFAGNETASVHQLFTGPVSGDALLLFNYDGAVMLSELLTEEKLLTRRLNESACEVLTEVGNIMLNACLGVFGNLLQVHVTFSVPRLHLESLNNLLGSLVIGNEEMRYALAVYTSFRLRDSLVSGCMVMALGVASLDRLIQSVEWWEKSEIEV